MRPASEELGLRILGQSQDVACQLELVALGGGCAALAAEHRAHAVMTVREPTEGGAYEVVVCDAAAGTEHVRSVPIEGGASDALRASAAYEAVALVVRSALLDVAAAHAAREEERAAQQRAAAAAAEARAREAQRVRDEAAARDREPADAASPSEPAFRVLAGAELALVAQTTLAPALHARVLARLGILRAGFGASYGLASELRDERVALSIARHSALAIANLELWAGAGWSIDLGAHAGVAALTRTTRARLGDTAPAADEVQWSALFGAELGAGLLFIGPLGLRAHVALDVVPGAPRYAYAEQTAEGEPLGERAIEGPQYLQPRFGIAVFAEL